MWKEWVNALLGLFIVVFGFYAAVSFWIVIAGLIVLILALWATLERASYKGQAANISAFR